MSFAWKCPYCNHNAMIGKENVSKALQVFDEDEGLGVESRVITCPNPECKEYSIYTYLGQVEWRFGKVEMDYEDLRKTWRLKPESSAKPFPSYIPEVLRIDYEEACLIKDLSPKASATLSRRCLQGIIRGFWKVERKNLYQEIEAIKDKVAPSLWKSIDAIREIGNIGAHMEKDINIIKEVEPREAELLIKLIEILFEKTYIRDHEENELFKEITQVAEVKKELKEAN